MVAADTKGTLYLYDRAGELSAQLSAELGTSASTITSIAIGSREDPFVAVGTLAGEVRLYNVTLPRLRSSAKSPPTSQETTLTLAMTSPAQLDDKGKPVPVLAMETYMRGRRAMIAVGDGAGAIRLLNRNGTYKSAVDVGGRVLGLERNAAVLAVASEGVGVSLFDMGKPSAPPTACLEEVDEAAASSVPAPTTAVAWDVQLNQLLYAATSTGQIKVCCTPRVSTCRLACAACAASYSNAPYGPRCLHLVHVPGLQHQGTLAADDWPIQKRVEACHRLQARHNDRRARPVPPRPCATQGLAALGIPCPPRRPQRLRALCARAR